MRPAPARADGWSKVGEISNFILLVDNLSIRFLKENTILGIFSQVVLSRLTPSSAKWQVVAFLWNGLGSGQQVWSLLK
jgi:hypothetical protein